jgi:branched-chain amino acid transport system ATP-binding protein
MKLLELRDVDAFYGISHILFQVSLEVDEGETVCLLGRNGVGKTTTLRCIMNLTPPRSGSIKLLGREIAGKRPFEVARRGLGFVPEDRIIFPDLTVKENLEMGIRGRAKDKGGWTLDRVYGLFPVLKERAAQEGQTLSGGEQQMLTIARTLMGNPRLLLLDEPTEGLAPLVVKAIGEQVRLLKEEGMTIILAEQNASFSLNLSDRAYILEKGAVCWSGASSRLKEQPEILERFLGV